MTQQALQQLYNGARKGDVVAMAVLGWLLKEGASGVRQDLSNAQAWLKMAADKNLLWAKEMLSEMDIAKKKGVNPARGTGDSASPMITNPYEELKSLIGLEKVKGEIESLGNLLRIQELRKKQGLKNTNVSYHCVFTGNPGTGKTTVARIVAGIYRELGILKKGHLVETDRSGLVAEYVGQTAPKTNKIIDSALDGVLFIDEAYSLVGGENDFGAEAVATLLKRMEDDRDRLVVILAGYTDEIKEFIDSNPGLQSRFNRYIQFDDYSAEELTKIFRLYMKKANYKIKRDAYDELQRYFQRAVENKDDNFGNGRFVRNTFEKVVQNHADRLSRMGTITPEQLSIIVSEDIIKLQ